MFLVSIWCRIVPLYLFGKLEFSEKFSSAYVGADIIRPQYHPANLLKFNVHTKIYFARAATSRPYKSYRTIRVNSSFGAVHPFSPKSPLDLGPFSWYNPNTEAKKDGTRHGRTRKQTSYQHRTPGPCVRVKTITMF